MTHRTPHDLERLEKNVREVGRLIGAAFDQVGAGFVLIGFSWGDGGFNSYVTNVDREDLVKALRETIVRLEKREDMPPIRAGEPSA